MKTVIITGANEGIGYYMAKYLLEHKHNVAVLDIHTNEIEKLMDRFNDQLLVIKCDVTKEIEVKESTKKVFAMFNSIDYAIHNACIAIFKSIDQCSDEDYQSVYNVNFLGAVHLINTVTPYMKLQNRGRIFLTSSGVGVMGFSKLSPYACSKGAIETLARCMKLEYDHTKISFHLLHPPLTRTTSAKILPIPEDFKANPEKVGYGLAKKLKSNKFIISHSFVQYIQNHLMYEMPLALGKLMNKMTEKAKISEEV